MNWAILRTPRWLITTLLAFAAIGVTARLGVWQLDRLEQRRAFNARVIAQMQSPRLDMNESLPVDRLYDMEYRKAVVRGRYDLSQQVLLRNQVWENRPGYHILTPLLIDGSGYAVIVDRGWVPFEDVDLSQVDQPGPVVVEGIIRRPQSRPDFGGVPEPTLEPGRQRYEALNLIDVERLQAQVDAPLLPVYLLQNPDPASTGLPYRAALDLELTEGPHLGYAIQWFIFSAIIAIGYPFLLLREMRRQPGAGERPIVGELRERPR